MSDGVDDEIVGAENDFNELSATQSTYSGLSSEIGSGGNIKLSYDYYTYDNGDTIEITTDNSVIDGNGAVSNCNFAICSAGEFGGVVCFFVNGDVSNCNFANNEAPTGGAVFLYRNGYVTNSNFTDNSAGTAGAVYLRENGEISNSNFIDNSAGTAGAVYLRGDSKISNSNFINNSAETAGAVYLREGGKLGTSNFTNNTATNGGAVLIDSGVVTSCIFVNNSATIYGGALSINGTVCVTNCNFSDNKVTDTVGYGGAIYWNGANGHVSGCSFVNNSACNSGGAICWKGTNGHVSDSSFANNSARVGGGAIRWVHDNGVVSGCSFVNNSAKWGGAIWWEHDNGVVSGCVFVNNSAEYGVIDFLNDRRMGTYMGRNLTINDNIFLNNEGLAISFDENDSTSNANYNWFGNNATNYDMAPGTNNTGITTWLFLNATANPDWIYIPDSSDIIFKLYAYSPEGISEYDNSRLSDVNLTLTPTNGRVNTTRAKLGEAVEYTPESMGIGSITATIESATYTVNAIIIGKDVEFNKAKGHPGRVDVNATVDVILSESDATGTVSIMVDGVEYSAELVDGAAIITLPLMPAGEYAFDVVYSGDHKYYNNSAPITVNINKYYPTMKSTAVSVRVDENATVNVVLPSDATGTVSITVNGSEYTAEVVDGTAAIVLPVISKDGSQAFDVAYSGDDKYRPQTTSVTFNVLKYKVAMKATARTVKLGNDVTVNVELSDGATGEVSITINGTTYTGVVEDGAGSIIIPNLPIGQYALDVDYTGDDYYKPGTAVVTFNVNKQSTTMKATARTVKVGDDVTVNVALASDATGDVIININGTDYTGTAADGIATILIPDLPAGQYALDVKYGGDDKYKNQSTTVKFNVNKYYVRMKATAKYEEGIARISVTLSDDATGIVSVNVNGTDYTASVANAKALIEIPDLAVGEYTFDVNYSGDAKYRNYTSTVGIVVTA